MRANVIDIWTDYVEPAINLETMHEWLESPAPKPSANIHTGMWEGSVLYCYFESFLPSSVLGGYMEPTLWEMFSDEFPRESEAHGIIYHGCNYHHISTYEQLSLVLNCILDAKAEMRLDKLEGRA